MPRNRRKMTFIGIIVAAIIAVGGIIAMNTASKPPQGVGTPREQLAPCPNSPNCVSSDAADKEHAIEPFPIVGTPRQTIELLASLVAALPGSGNVLTQDNYLHAEFRSSWLRFVDDVEFLVDPKKNLVHVRSASRIGWSDFGVNRKRVEAIRTAYEATSRSIKKTVEATGDGETDMPDEEDEFAVIEKSDDEWRKQLTREQYYVTREHGTERAFTGPDWDNKKPGIYTCVACGLPLFSSDTKYESGTGWPSFWEPIKETRVEKQVDRSLFSVRTEVHCRRCKSHLGHVFPDGPEPTGLRYCMNGVAMKFEPTKKEADSGTETNEK